MIRLIGVVLWLSSVLSAIEVAVSVVPQQYLLEQIGGDLVQVQVMVPNGSSPHTYEPKSSEMKALSRAKLYFTVGVEFETAWLERFRSANAQMQIVDSAAGIELIEAPHGADDHHDHGMHDPHIWTSPANVRLMAQNMAQALIKADPQGTERYQAGLRAFYATIDQTDAAIRQALIKTPKGSKFMVFHPAWGYFARDYGLEQLAIEIEGKEPKPKALKTLIERAKKEQIRAVITQKEFSDQSARVLADALDIEVKSFSPLHPNWSENLISLAQAIAR